MESLILLIPLSVLLVAGGIAVFLWAVDNGQFDDLDAGADQALADESTAPPTNPTHPRT